MNYCITIFILKTGSDIALKSQCILNEYGQLINIKYYANYVSPLCKNHTVSLLNSLCLYCIENTSRLSVFIGYVLE